MPSLSRNDTSPLSTWWRTSDRTTLICALILPFIGSVLVMAASPAVALRIGASGRNFFIFKQTAFLFASSVLMLYLSRLSRQTILYLGIAGTIIMLTLTLFALISGTEIKGARRWVSLPFFSFQPSEFLKPCFAVLAAFLLSTNNRQKRFLYLTLAWGLWIAIIAILKLQPDVGMLTVITIVFLSQNLIAGLSAKIFVILSGGVFTLFAWILLTSHHARVRMAEFWHGSSSEHYQIDMSLRAFSHGGLFGQGLGEGKIKNFIPDSHADFIFAVAGEECGTLFCFGIIILFAVIIYSTLKRLRNINDPFVIIAATGLITGLGLQACINMASTLALMPTKGMTLPLISYGGSSALSIAMVLGMTLGLTRKYPGDYQNG